MPMKCFLLQGFAMCLPAAIQCWPRLLPNSKVWVYIPTIMNSSRGPRGGMIAAVSAAKRSASGLGCAMVLLVFVSCGVETLEPACSDPLGADAEVIDYVDRVQVNVDEKFFWIPYQFMCFQPLVNDCFGFDMDEAQPYVRAFYIPEGDHTYGSIIDVGKKTCLRDVTEKPEEGWSYSAPLLLHHGYVIRKSDGTYGRFFIDSWQAGSDDRKTKINIIRQYAF